MTTRWTVEAGDYTYRVLDEKGLRVCSIPTQRIGQKELAAQIVRDHNRAEAFEAMRVSSKAILDWHEIPERTSANFQQLPYLISKLKAALAQAEQVDSK